MLVIALLLLAQPDPCSWLTPAQIQKAFGGASFAQPQRSTAVPAYSGQTPGTRCEYAGNGGNNVELIVYIDHSPAEAQATFQKLSAFYPATSKPSGIGDAAYFDQQHAIHVLKGKTRFYINISSSDPDATREKQARDFATSIVAKL
jgi:hypothetical protein